MMDSPQNERLSDIVERVLQVRSFPIFANATQEQASLIARYMQEFVFPEGSVLFMRGEVADSIYLIVEGTVRLMRDSGPVRAGPHEAAGGHSMIEGLPRDATAIAETRVRTFRLRRDDVLDLLEDHFDLALAALAALAGFLLQQPGPRQPLFDLGGWHPVCAVCLEADLVQRLIYLRSLRNSGTPTIQELAQLATVATMHRAAPGEMLYRAGDPPDAYWLLVEGRVKIHGQGHDQSCDAPHVPGALHVLAGRPRDETCVVEEPSLLMRVPAEAWVDLLEDHFDLVRSLLARLSYQIRQQRTGLVSTPG